MIETYLSHTPNCHCDAFIASTAVIIGQVSVEEQANIWYNTVIRGDVEPIKVGKSTNVQDQCVLHTSKHYPLTIGEAVTIGHGAIVHGCTIESYVLVGMGSIILDGAIIETEVIIGAGSLVPPGKRIPAGSMVMGSPARVVRELTAEERLSIRKSAQGYVELSKQYKSK